MSNLTIFANHALIAALTGWVIAQLVKVPLHYLHARQWNWSLLFTAGGMPSSHSALVAGLAHCLGLLYGFDSPFYAIGFTVAMVVIYDATGIRRQAGIHAQTINKLVEEVFHGRPVTQTQLREVLGHTPMEALGGFILGVVVALLMWFVWR